MRGPQERQDEQGTWGRSRRHKACSEVWRTEEGKVFGFQKQVHSLAGWTHELAVKLSDSFLSLDPVVNLLPLILGSFSILVPTNGKCIERRT